VECEDRSRVCAITGYILPEVRHSVNEFQDTVVNEKHSCPKKILPSENDLLGEVEQTVRSFLTSQRARTCRERENERQSLRIRQHMTRIMKTFKLKNTTQIPNVCVVLAQAISQEKYWRFIEIASDELIDKASHEIFKCMQEMRKRGLKIPPGGRTREIVCGLMYMLKHGLIYNDRLILANIPEMDKCLPHENKTKTYFGISSKVICMTENEVKLIFRESFQR
jgi:hypothetical protein